MSLNTKIDEILANLRAGATTVTSEYRNEDAQTKMKLRRIDTLKKKSKKKSKILVVTELALPFNPFTGKEDEKYNRNNKYRPIMSTETAMLTYKQLANEIPETKEAFATRVGLQVDEWDTSDVTTITSVDRRVFNKHRYPVIFTLNVVDINIPTFTGLPFPKQYRVDVDRDKESGAIIGETPLPLKIHKLMADMANEAVNKLNNDVKSGVADMNQDDLKEARKKEYKKIVVSEDKPLNFVLALELPLNNQSTFDDSLQLSDLTDEDLFKMLRLVKQTSSFQAALDNYMNGSYTILDVYNNFWELDMLCPATDDNKELGKDTKFEKAMLALKSVEKYPNLNQSFVDFMDKDQKLESIFLASSYVSRFNADLEANLIDAVEGLIDLDDERLTARVLRANQDIIPVIFGSDGDAKLVEAEIGLVPEGELDEKVAAEDAKRMNITNLLDNDELSLEDDDL